MPFIVKLSEATQARRTLQVFVVNNDGTTGDALQGGGTAQMVQPGATAFAAIGTLSSLGTTGHYNLILATADIGTLGPARIRYKGGTTLEAYADVLVVAYDPYDGTGLGLSRVDAAISSRSSHASADVWAAAARTLTGTTGFGLAADQSAVTIGTVNFAGTSGTLNVNKDKAGYTAAVVSDKSGYSLAADQSAVTVGTVNQVGTVAYVGTAGTLVVNADKSGYVLASFTGQPRTDLLGENLDFEAGTGARKARLDAAISSRSSHASADVWNVATRAITDKAGFSLAADQSAVTVGTVTLVGTVGTLGTQAKADVNAEVVDAVATDTIAELGVGVPAATPTMRTGLMLLYMDQRNKVTQTGSLRQVFNDAGTAIAQATLTDDGAVFTKTEYGAP